jgi:hypothetical protein
MTSTTTEADRLARLTATLERILDLLEPLLDKQAPEPRP